MEDTVYFYIKKCINFQFDIWPIIRCKDWKTEKETRECEGKGMKRERRKPDRRIDQNSSILH